MIVDLFLVYQFISKLVRPFTDWQAYKLGIIDADGQVLIKRRNQTPEQKKAWGYFDILIANLKKLLAKLPGGSSRIATWAAALLLIKEEERLRHGQMLEEDLENRDLESELNEMIEFIREEVPVNNASGGNIAGLDGNPPVAIKNKYKKKNQADTVTLLRRLRNKH